MFANDSGNTASVTGSAGDQFVLVVRKERAMRRSVRWGSVLAAICAAVGGGTVAVAAAPAAAANACPWVGQHASPTQRADEVLARMTLDEKIQLVHGIGIQTYVGEIPAIPRLCVPAMNLEDGPAGVADGMTGVTQLPAPVAIASTWDPGMARQYGAVIGAEEWGKGANVDLGPTVNIVRDPRWGRAFETYSEDPYLTGQIGVADIRGVQGQGALAQVKHFAVYNQETNRNTPADNAVVDQRTLREIYLPQFEAAVEQGGASSVMCSYSTINGVDACENGFLQNQVLKGQWRFPGFVTSDWWATHSTVAAANNGLDMEMPDATYFGAPLKAAVQAGQVPMSRLNDMVGRILTEEFRFGLFDRSNTGSPSAVVTNSRHAAVARNVAEQGSVLLKNSGGTLPLNTAKVHSIAVIGDDAGPDAMSGGGGSAHVLPPYVVTPYQGIRARAGARANVSYAQGIESISAFSAIPAQYLSTPYRAGSSYTATLTPPSTGDYVLAVADTSGSYTPTTLSVNGTPLFAVAATPGDQADSALVHLRAGQHYQVTIDGPSTSLTWSDSATTARTIGQAVAVARSSSVAVVFAGTPESEAMDRPNLGLDGGQDALISAVAAANPNTVVVLNTGSAVTMPWVGSVRSVVEAWYPGQEDGNAIAAVLFGDVNPSGKLPVTFPRSLSDVPASTTAQWPGVDGQVRYSEGLDVGYRWYTAKNVTPLFAFGSGLSYTTFRFSHLRVVPGHGQVTVTADITNTGRRAGADVVQAYVGAPASTGEPPEQLKGFRKVQLNPGRTQRVTFHLDRTAFAQWSTASNGWVVAGGTYRIMVGDSSADLPLHTALTLR
jgi:beta-glucosidase